MAHNFKNKPSLFSSGFYHLPAIVFLLPVLFSLNPVFAEGNIENSGGNKEIIFVSGNNVTSFYRNELILIPSDDADDNRIHMIADTYPGLSYPGGIFSFIDQRLEYPEKALFNNTEGVVLVNFVVEKDGSISNASILRGIGDGCDEEVLRVLEELPVMNPGSINSKPVRVAITLPVRFKLKY
jgi:TonB family protein